MSYLKLGTDFDLMPIYFIDRSDLKCFTSCKKAQPVEFLSYYRQIMVSNLDLPPKNLLNR